MGSFKPEKWVCLASLWNVFSFWNFCIINWLVVFSISCYYSNTLLIEIFILYVTWVPIPHSRSRGVASPPEVTWFLPPKYRQFSPIQKHPLLFVYYIMVCSIGNSSTWRRFSYSPTLGKYLIYKELIFRFYYWIF